LKTWKCVGGKEKSFRDSKFWNVVGPIKSTLLLRIKQKALGNFYGWFLAPRYSHEILRSWYK